MNDETNTSFLNNNDLVSKKFQDQHQQPISHKEEIDKQSLLLKIQKAQQSLAMASSKLEESKKVVSGLSEYEKKKLGERLDDLQAMLHFGEFKISERENSGQQLNPEERNLEVLKETIKHNAEKVHEQKWNEEQYITPQLQQMDEYLENSRDMMDEIDSHIRK